jgi:class 3 adenylate cyclase
MSDSPIQRRLSTVFATDAVGYSRMMHADEEGTLRTLAGHRKTIDAIIEKRGGRIFGTAGDSVLAEFASPVECVRCATEVQEALLERNRELPEDKRMLFRIGINLGDITVKEGDLLGDGVNIAARLESICAPGGIVISGSVHDQVLGKLPLGFKDLGPQNLKNISRPVRAYSIVEGAATPLPSPDNKKTARPAWHWAVAAVLLIGLATAARYWPFGDGTASSTADAGGATDPKLLLYDGDWRAILECLPTKTRNAFFDSAEATIRNGQLSFKRGNPGDADYFMARGQIHDGDQLLILGERFSRIKKRSFPMEFDGTFTQLNRFESNGNLGRRQCTLQLVR